MEKIEQMTANLKQSTYRLRFQIGDRTLFSVGNRVCVKQISLADTLSETDAGPQLGTSLPSDCNGFLFRGVLDKFGERDIYTEGDYLCYIISRVPRYFIEFGESFDRYIENNFSSKTRATIRRKVKKFAKYSGGELDWKAYRTPDEMMEFHAQARKVATETYQEKLFEGGLPHDEKFIETMRRESALDNIRAYLLFHNGQPVSYLYLRSNKGTLTYDYMGYLPEYAKFSVGTVLQWVVLASLFSEGKFRLFDFTEGEGSHKRLFATNSLQTANIIYLRRNLSNYLLVKAHRMCNGISAFSGKTLETFGIKKTVKKFIRFGVRSPWHQPS